MIHLHTRNGVGFRSQTRGKVVAKHSEYFVERRDNGDWVVKLPHAERASAVVSTQQEAIRRAKELAPEGVIHLKQRNGKFRKI
jgi:hypothetical protein